LIAEDGQPLGSTRKPDRRVFDDEALQAAFDCDGYVVVDLLGEPEVRALRDWFDGHPDSVYDAEFGSSVHSPSDTYRTEAARFVSSVFRLVERGLLPDYRVAASGFLCKQPHAGHVKLHQDPTMVFEDRYTPVQFWVPLIDVDATNGCMRVLRGSHVLNREWRASEIPFPYESLLSTNDTDLLTDVTMRAGQALVFGPMLFHGSPTNETDERRTVAASILVPGEAELLYVDPDDRENPSRLDVYVVDDSHYQAKVFMSRPVGGEPLCAVEYRATPLDPRQLATLAAERRAHS
jgi:ectoine hydroxylase-related dioxygenase (phytanoyl-CoA dioxygenase family)